MYSWKIGSSIKQLGQDSKSGTAYIGQTEQDNQEGKPGQNKQDRKVKIWQRENYNKDRTIVTGELGTRLVVQYGQDRNKSAGTGQQE